MLRFLTMMSHWSLTVCLAVLILSGCAHTPVKTATSVPALVTGSVIEPALLAHGGRLALVSLKAGPQAEANDELEGLSTAVLTGIKDSLDAQKTSLHVMKAQEGQPQVVLEGYVQEFSQTGRLSRLMMHPNRDHLVLVGEIWLRRTGERLLTFSAGKKFDPQKEKPMKVAYELGQGIGNFIGAHTR
ncbi:MAG: hypothetical protein HY209_04965 [Candidatus Omnitrophica bacterium]|nr:hypothetical protein [Candidatus Omnitrophota bacterium]